MTQPGDRIGAVIEVNGVGSVDGTFLLHDSALAVLGSGTGMSLHQIDSLDYYSIGIRKNFEDSADLALVVSGYYLDCVTFANFHIISS
jgi:hypothetical protein